MPPVIPRPQGSASSADSKFYAVYAEMPAGYEVVTSAPLKYGDGGWAGWGEPGKPGQTHNERLVLSKAKGLALSETEGR